MLKNKIILILILYKIKTEVHTSDKIEGKIKDKHKKGNDIKVDGKDAKIIDNTVYSNEKEKKHQKANDLEKKFYGKQKIGDTSTIELKPTHNNYDIYIQYKKAYIKFFKVIQDRCDKNLENIYKEYLNKKQKATEEFLQNEKKYKVSNYSLYLILKNGYKSYLSDLEKNYKLINKNRVISNCVKEANALNKNWLVTRNMILKKYGIGSEYVDHIYYRYTKTWKTKYYEYYYTYSYKFIKVDGKEVLVKVKVNMDNNKIEEIKDNNGKTYEIPKYENQINGNKNKIIYNSHLVNKKLAEYHQQLLDQHKSLNDKINDSKKPINAITQNLIDGSDHQKKLNEITNKLNQIKNSNPSNFRNLVKEYNNLVNAYNKNKNQYCPDLISLKDAKPVEPESPKFHCQQIALVCSRYTAFTMLLQKLFDPEINTFKPEDYFIKNGDCLKNKIKKLILTDSEKQNNTNNKKVEMSFKAKCCNSTMENFVKMNNNKVIEIKDPLNIDIKSLKFPHLDASLPEASKEIKQAINQMISKTITQ